MTLTKDNFKLYESIVAYLSDLDIQIVSSNAVFQKPLSRDDFPKVIRRGEIVLSKGEGYPSIDELADGLNSDVEDCKYTTTKEIKVGEDKQKIIYALFSVIYNSKPKPKFEEGKTNKRDYTLSMRLWRNKSKTLIEIVKISYE